MAQGLIEKYRHEQYPGSVQVNTWLHEFLSQPVSELNKAITRDPWGNVALLTRVGDDGKVCVIEVVVSKGKEGAPEISAGAYRPAPMFSSVGELTRARRDVIETLEDIIDKPLGADAGFYDPVRGRDVNLREASFGQLYDLMVAEVRRRGFGG